jgi:2-phosphosulfolactate phosphatase
MARRVVIDCFPSSAARYTRDHAIVAVDVIRATTLAVTAVAAGRRCFVAADLAGAFSLREGLGGAILAGELKGDMPDGFDLNNSPSDLDLRTDTEVPVVTLSTSGTRLMLEAARSRHGAYAACFRNYSATARHLATHQGPVAVIGAGSRSEFREEDQMCCAWIAGQLVEAGFQPADQGTADIIERWRGAPASACDAGASVGYLRRTGQLRDRDFILGHVDDLQTICGLDGNEIVRLPIAVGPGAAHLRSVGRGSTQPEASRLTS